MNKEKSMAMGGADSTSQSRSATAHPDVLKTLGWVKEHLSDSVIVESGKTSTGWWRVWSDGFIEQGGRATTSNSVYTTVTLPKAFTTTTYYVVGSGERPNRIETHENFIVSSRTETSFTYTGFNSVTAAWYAAGY